eukprot:4979434-Prymnesium_polylepis.2
MRRLVRRVHTSSPPPPPRPSLDKRRAHTPPQTHPPHEIHQAHRLAARIQPSPRPTTQINKYSKGIIHPRTAHWLKPWDLVISCSVIFTGDPLTMSSRATTYGSAPARP